MEDKNKIVKEKDARTMVEVKKELGELALDEKHQIIINFKKRKEEPKDE